MSSRCDVCVVGASGYAGSAISRAFREADVSVCGTFFRHRVPGERLRRLDVSDGEAVENLLRSWSPRIVINAAADWSTKSAMEATIVQGARNLAAACADVGCRLIHISTDVVFDGRKGCYTESDAPRPVHDYGKAKARAEVEISTLRDYLIIRTSLIIGHDGADAQSRWIRSALSRGSQIVLFTDEYRSPIWVEDLAGGIVRLAEAEVGGVVHLAGTQGLSRYQLGVFLAERLGLDPAGITPGLQEESGLVRPKDCTLNVNKATGLGVRLRPLAPQMEGKYCV